jgi:D-sedoheptulose 7-phosphate isomerase
LLIAVSSSGMSQNILRAVAACRDKGCEVITMSGFSPANELRKLGGLNFYVPADSYGSVELAHSILGHFLTDVAAASVAPAQPASDWTAQPANANGKTAAAPSLAAIPAKVR